MGAPKKSTKTPKQTSAPRAEPEAEVEDDAKGGTAARPDEMPPDVLEFIHAIDTYKRVHQRKFPNWSEILEILKGLGYSRAR